MILKKIKENKLKIMYQIDIEKIEIDNKIFKVKKSTSNLSNYLNSIGSSLISYLNFFIDNNCKYCEGVILNNRFERNIFHTYKYCGDCIKNKNYNLLDVRKCSICGCDVYKKDLKNGTCGEETCLDEFKKMKNLKIKNTHWTKDIKKRKVIINDRTNTRKINDRKYNRKYVAWNKGKVGIYSKDTIEKIRQGVINYMNTGKIKKTGIEKKMDNFLNMKGLDYKYSFILKNRQYDFLIINYKIIIETDGDFWHGNPKFYDDNDTNKKKLYENQKIKRIDDKIKNRIAIENGYTILRFWEYDINNNFNDVINIIEEEIKIKMKNEKGNIKDS